MSAPSAFVPMAMLPSSAPLHPSSALVPMAMLLLLFGLLPSAVTAAARRVKKLR
jgi:hypothetical protein